MSYLMNERVNDVAKNATQASTSSAKAREEAESGREVVDETIVAISRVKEQAEKLKENMRELENKAESIGQIVQVISEIADQTNLLALNAAIEAARAGEAGRGFAVVADEVRKLAEKTMAATKEVEDVINGIQRASRENMKNVKFATTAIEEATSKANESGNALKNIVDLAKDTNTQIQGIADAAEKQSIFMEEINRTIEQVNEIVSATSDSIIQSSEAISELAKMAVQLKEVIEELES
jgi:methyl-accepting chemotaxis protein